MSLKICCRFLSSNHHSIPLVQVSLLDRKSFTAHLDQVFDMMDQRVKSTLDGVDFVCITVDVCEQHTTKAFLA